MNVVTRKEDLLKLVLKCTNPVLQARQKLEMVFLKAIKIWNVQNHLHISGITQLRRDYITFFGITNMKSVPGVCAFKRVVEKLKTYGSVNNEETNNK